MREIVGWSLRALLAALFLYAGVAKLADVRTFAVDIANYQMLPLALVVPLAVTLPGVEIACGVALLTSRMARPAALLAIGMIAAFTAAAVQALARDINIDCGCFGGVRAPVTIATIVRDVGLIAVALGAFALSPRRAGDRPQTKKPSG
jgi:uncharacterized membrane protein YphA (DoxX/SURF4 family)